MSLTHALTVDVEEHFQVSAFERDCPREQWASCESRVGANTRFLLDLFDDHRVRATFFVLGWVAERQPALVREIHERGHEVASHGYWHRLVYTQSEAEFRDDIRRSRQQLEDLVGREVVAYRAPSFSITKRSEWALRVLVEEGFRVDSSIFPVRHDRYGMPNARREIHQVETPAGQLCEFPPSVARVAGMHWPVGGGGYFRLYPYWLTRQALRRIDRAGRPVMFYLHPWEIDPEQPRIASRSRVSRFRHYVNLRTTRRKLARVLSEFRWGTVSQVLTEHGTPVRPLPMSTASSRFGLDTASGERE